MTHRANIPPPRGAHSRFMEPVEEPDHGLSLPPCSGRRGAGGARGARGPGRRAGAGRRRPPRLGRHGPGAAEPRRAARPAADVPGRGAGPAGRRRRAAAAPTPPLPRELSRDASAVQTPEQFADLVKRHWPKAAPKDGDTAMLRGLLRNVPGSLLIDGPALLPAQQQELGELYVGTGIQVAFDQTE